MSDFSKLLLITFINSLVASITMTWLFNSTKGRVVAGPPKRAEKK